MRAMRGGMLGAALLAVVGALAWPAEAARARCSDGWLLAVPEPVPEKPTTLGAISGIVELAPGRWLVAHDAKRAFDAPGGTPATRLHVVEAGRARGLLRTPLAWPGTQANDLEALARLPGTGGDVLAVESGENTGRPAWYQLRVEGLNVVVRATGVLDGAPLQVEGFAVACLGGRLVAVWAGRGTGTTPARVNWGVVARATDGRVVAVVPARGYADVVAPCLPSSDPNTRHVSDLAIDGSGTVWATAAVDVGNAGPLDRYQSVVYRAGRLCSRCDGVAFERACSLRPWCSLYGHKVEGIALTRCGPVLASDDENFGGYLRLP